MFVALSPNATADRVDRLIVLEEADRGLLAGRLHDGLVQDLLATRYLLDLALSAAAKGADVPALELRLQAIRDAAASALAGSRTLLSELTARSVDGLNLTGAVHAASASASTGDANDSELPPVPPAVAVVVHRLVRAITSSARPEDLSDAGMAELDRRDVIPVSVSVSRTADVLSVTCTPAPDPGAAPIAGWLERAGMLGASVTVEPGSTAIIRFPMSLAADSCCPPEGS